MNPIIPVFHYSNIPGKVPEILYDQNVAEILPKNSGTSGLNSLTNISIFPYKSERNRTGENWIGEGTLLPLHVPNEWGAEGLRDVIIVGGGPVGSYAASLLSTRGFDVLVLERNPSVGQRVVCAGLIGTEAFDRFHLPREPVISQIQNVTFFSPSGIRFSYRTEAPMAFMVDRHRFDREMASTAMNNGAEVRCRSLVRDVRIRDDGVIVEVGGHRGTYHLRGKLAVVACGFNPSLTQRLGLMSPTEYVLGAAGELDVDGVKGTEIHVGENIAPGSFAWVVPVKAEKVKIGMTTRKNANLFLRSFLNNPRFRDRIKTHDPKINVDVIPIRPIKKSFRERILVVGEAAGQVKSTTCGGIYYGLISAEFAARTAEEAFSKDRFDDHILSKYEQRWRRELGGELEIGYRFRQLFSTIKDRQIDRLFEILNSDGIVHLIRSKAKFDWHKDFILALARHAVVGKYLPPITVLAGRALK